MPPDAPPTRSLLVIEDGHEYEEFARLFLADGFAIRAAHSAAEALARLTEAPADAFLVDLRFEPCWDVMREEVPTPRSGRWSQYEAKFSLSLELGRIFLLIV